MMEVETVGRPRKYEKCFFCNEKMIKELGRVLKITKTKTDRETGREVTEDVGRSWVCFQCEEPCSK